STTRTQHSPSPKPHRGALHDSGGTTVPLDISRDKRLFTAAMRKALYIRDRCCIKCGAPAARTQAHHIVHWADDGETTVANGCLLCPSCHADVHHNGWDVTIGLDKHPWLIPPATLDPRRQPIPAHNRRTMTVDNLPTAA
ncbi:HNH endonuclease, partial [Gordonia sp. DT101]|uniref:HNH endonuclease n=1 Tax=Gordonia sp. DT101 TaxID=3416545 RepID=UPI003CED30F6